jgi:hypothetical protein
MPDWPQLDWTVPPTGADAWAQERVASAAAVVRGFEAALEDGAKAGELDLAAIGDELARWDQAALAIFMYTKMGGEKPIPSDVRRLATELRRAWNELAGLRGQMLARLGAAAGRVLDREAASPVDRSLFRPREAPAAAPSLAHFAGEHAAVAEPSRAFPVKAEEVRMRQLAEQKPIPDSRSLGALLGILPSDWVAALFEQLEVPVDEDDEMTVGSRAVAQRGGIFARLKDPAFLEHLVGSLSAEERALLGEVLKAKGAVPYGRIGARWGHDESDGFYWSRRAPVGPLSRRRRLGLLFVGTQKGTAVVAAPADLAEALKALLAAP